MSPNLLRKKVLDKYHKFCRWNRPCIIYICFASLYVWFGSERPSYIEKYTDTMRSQVCAYTVIQSKYDYKLQLMLFKYYLQNEQECFIGYKARGDSQVFWIRQSTYCELFGCLIKRTSLYGNSLRKFGNLCFQRQKIQRIWGEFPGKARVCITYTDTTWLWFSFVFSSWILNEFYNTLSMFDKWCSVRYWYKPESYR